MAQDGEGTAVFQFWRWVENLLAPAEDPGEGGVWVFAIGYDVWWAMPTDQLHRDCEKRSGGDALPYV